MSKKLTWEKIQRELADLYADIEAMEEERDQLRTQAATMREALRKAHLELTILHGCNANDASYADQAMISTWQIDTKTVTDGIERVLMAT